MPEWLMGADCKFAGYTYAGSNPARPKNLILKLLYKHNNYIYSGSRIRTYDLKVMSLASYQTTLSRNLIHKN